MILIFATPEEARVLLGLSTRQPEILRPQTSGPCVHYDERSEHAADAYPCTYPYGDGVCPHLDNPDIICPVKDEWLAESDGIDSDLAWAWGDDLPEFVSLAQDPEGRGHDLAAEATDTPPRSDYVLAPRDPQEQVADAEEPEPEFPALEPDDGALHTYTVPCDPQADEPERVER